MDLLRYDFGYEWPWTWGHMIAAVCFGALAAGLVRVRWRRAGALCAALTLLTGDSRCVWATCARCPSSRGPSTAP